MMTLPLSGDLREVLVLGAHCDDVEIGCGGTLLALARACPQVRLHIALFSGDDARAAESRAAVQRLLPPDVQHEIEIHAFRDGFFPAEQAGIKERFEELKGRCNPDIVFTHFGRDAHQDHRVVSELTWNTFRNNLVLEYEIPKYDGDLGRPNFYAPLAADVTQHKIDTLLECFPSQAGKRWFTGDLFAALMRLRGMECNAPSGFAEAFHARKLVARW
jgi:LmbE family N-acetylglucosaminyl deacetylase